MQYSELIDILHQGNNPYPGFSHRRYRSDLHGWNSRHRYLRKTIEQLRPNLAVEIGVWKGGSTIHMAGIMKELGIAGTIIAVDTWLGSWEHWGGKQWHDELLLQNGYPTLYYTFLTNVVEAELSGYIIPLPLDSGNASVLLQRRNIRPQLIHVDAAHDYDAVAADLRRWWPLLDFGGIMIMDDYDPDGKVWPSVKAAVEDFLAITPHENFEAEPVKCRFSKPAKI